MPSYFFVFLVEMVFHHIGQAGFELLTSDDQPASASQSAGITGRIPVFSPTKQGYECGPCKAAGKARR